MMKRLLCVVVAAALAGMLTVDDAHAQRHPGSLGIGVGSTTLASGLSIKSIAGPSAFQLVAGCWGGCDGVAVSIDALATMPPLVVHEALLLGWNFGFGGALGVGDDRFGAAGAFVAGLEFIMRPLPIDLVLEWRPSVRILPDVDVEPVTFGGHLRFYP